MRITILTTAVLLLSACQPDEVSIPAHTSGSEESHSVEIGPDYSHQLYYSLEDKTVIRQNVKTEWDLGFESAEEGYHIVLNSALYNAVAHVNKEFSSPLQLDSLDWKYDSSKGDLDSTAFGDYRQLTGFFALDLGRNVDGSSRGYIRLQILSHSESEYSIRVADLALTSEDTFTIAKAANTTYTCFSIDRQSVVDIEPHRADWDLWFTPYTYVFHNPPLPYSVTGVLINPHQVEVAISSYSWENTTYESSTALSFSSQRDVIGYEWKEYNFDSGLYEIDNSIIYVIRSVSGKIYKLRFTDFYNNVGERGYPTFDLVEL
ncbi:MAG: hypothetical protein EP346_03565 [Bacteroidetes bacterium]|nr:MAG: hypothetical protein EP346_03565 [Bacteroidota bacterium]